jgi:ABC-2 type transport system permease protein
MGTAKALALRAFADARVRTLSFALIFFLYAVAQVAGYKKAFPTLADRISVAQSFNNNAALELFYGTPHHMETIGGYVSWRVGGLLALCAAFFGAYIAVCALRTEEESGRFEIVIAGAIGRGAAFTARTAAIGTTIAVLWLATTVGLAAGGLPAAGSASLALGIVSVAAVYAGLGAVASQFAPTGRGALQLVGAVLGLDFLVRVIADTTGRPGLHWLTPLGWAEELQPFAGLRPAVLLLPAVLAVASLLLAGALERRRDVGTGLFAARATTGKPHLRLLRSPTLFAVRAEAVTFVVWAAGVGGFAFILGLLAKTVASMSLPANLRQEVSKLGAGGLSTVSSVLGLYFIFFVLAMSLFCCGQLGAARDEEAQGRLETLFALPEGRISWLTGRLVLAVAGATLIGIVAGLGAALGAVAAGSDVSFGSLIEAGLNCLPASLLFLGVGALCVAVAPRSGAGIAYAFVGATFLWELVGGLLGVPAWLLGLSPFNQIGLVPAQSFRAGPAAAMLAIGVVAATAALVRFRTRDLVGA